MSHLQYRQGPPQPRWSLSYPELVRPEPTKLAYQLSSIPARPSPFTCLHVRGLAEPLNPAMTSATIVALASLARPLLLDITLTQHAVDLSVICNAADGAGATRALRGTAVSCDVTASDYLA